jgi:hypothetical protein
MAHYAKLDTDNIVLQVEHVNDSDCMKNGVFDEETGRQYQENIHGHANWKQTSFNTFSNQHYDPETGQLSADQSKAFRGNYASIGYTYDPQKDVFIPPKPYASWLWSDVIANWQAPTVKPSHADLSELYAIYWSEPNLRWEAFSESDPLIYWNSVDQTWINA